MGSAKSAVAQAEPALTKRYDTHTKPIAKRISGVLRRESGETDSCIKQNDVVWAAWHERAFHLACLAQLAFQPGSKHTCLAGTAGRFVPRNLSVACLLVPDCRMTRLCSTTTFCRSPPRPRPRELNLGASRPAYPKTYPHKFQRCKNVPSTTRSRTPPTNRYGVPGNSSGQRAANHHASSNAA